MTADETIRTKARYELFKLHWLMSHGRTLTELLDRILEYRQLGIDEADDDEKNAIAEELNDAGKLLESWEYEDGFGGEIYPCFEEFLECDDKLMAETGMYERNKAFLETVAAGFRTEESEPNA